MEWASDDPDRHRATIALLTAAVDAAPADARRWQQLAAAHMGADAPADAMRTLQEAMSRFPDDVFVHLRVSRVARLLRDLTTALETSRRALELAPANPDAIVERFIVLETAGRVDESRPLVDSVLALKPTGLDALRTLTRALIRLSRIDDAVDLCRSAVDGAPDQSHAVLHLATALAAAGRDDEARSLIDLGRFVRRIRLPVPSGFASHAEFCGALADEIRRNPTLAHDPPGTATVGGLQTLRVRQPDATAVRALLALVRSAVSEYADALSAEAADHPFVRGRPSRARLDAWAVVYADHGRQTVHIHESGWLSGVYYVAVPSAKDDPSRGALVIGGGLPDQPVKWPWDEIVVAPSPGDLILFPSWLPHATRPTLVAEDRIVVSFDAIPAS